MTDLVIREKPEKNFLGRAVHDLKNPLAVVRASLEWLQVELTDRPDALEAVGDAAAASERLVVIVDDLDSLARLGEHEKPGGARFGVFPLVTTVVRQTGARLARQGLTVKAIGKDAIELVGDARLLERSIAALVDATARGVATGSCIEVTVARVVSSSSDATVEIGVALRGAVDVGAPGVTLDPLETSGLGVFVAQRVVEAHGGTLTVVPTTNHPRIVVRIPV